MGLRVKNPAVITLSLDNSQSRGCKPPLNWWYAYASLGLTVNLPVFAYTTSPNGFLGAVTTLRDFTGRVQLESNVEYTWAYDAGPVAVSEPTSLALLSRASRIRRSP